MDAPENRFLGVCPLCGKPVKPLHHALVYHMKCLEDSFAGVRELLNPNPKPKENPPCAPIVMTDLA